MRGGAFLMSKFHIEDRLRSFARMVTGDYDLKVIFTGSTASITVGEMRIPPLENTKDAFSLAKFLVAHESGHNLFSIMDLKEKASKESALLADILNSLEDARIEGLMTRRYEGLDALFEAEIGKIIGEKDYSRIPLSTQTLHGLYMMGKGYDTSPIPKEARDLIYSMGKLVDKAVKAKDSHGVLQVSREIYGKLKRLEDGHKAQKSRSLVPGSDNVNGKSLPDEVIDSLEEYKLDPDYDDMGDYPHMKDENVDEGETEIIPDKRPLSQYLDLIRHHTRHQGYLIQHLKSLVETKRRRSRRKSVQTMLTSGSPDMKRLWKIAAGDDRVMKQRLNRPNMNRETDPDSLAVYILLDESHSMRTGDRIGYSKEAVAVLGEVLHELSISFAVTGYSTNPGLKRYLYKQFHEDYYDVRTRLVSATNRNGTYTQEHIPYVLRKLEGRKERKKILITATDAEDIESEIRFKRAVELARDAGVELLGLGINTSFMAEHFHRFIELTDLNRFGEELLRVLSSALQS
ncbi:VWA domain-containing protein [Candidatus Poribacteria bacterium]|nr:VWA domain-containing protein [Candidatus Poribacteria bacterium]